MRRLLDSVAMKQLLMERRGTSQLGTLLWRSSGATKLTHAAHDAETIWTRSAAVDAVAQCAGTASLNLVVIGAGSSLTRGKISTVRNAGEVVTILLQEQKQWHNERRGKPRLNSDLIVQG